MALPKIAIVGARLGGSLLGIYLARRGWPVQLFELRGDLRREPVETTAVAPTTGEPFSPSFRPYASRTSTVLALLSTDNFHELHHTVRRPIVTARKRTLIFLNRVFRQHSVPLYTMISHSTMPYTEEMERHRRQERIAPLAGSRSSGVGRVPQCTPAHRPRPAPRHPPGPARRRRGPTGDRHPDRRPPPESLPRTLSPGPSRASRPVDPVEPDEREENMSAEKLYLSPNVVVEPLIDNWYAWAHLIPPATAATNIVGRHLTIIESYVKAPQAHAAAVKNPAMLGGPFIDYRESKVPQIQDLIERTKRERTHLIELAADSSARRKSCWTEVASPFACGKYARYLLRE